MKKFLLPGDINEKIKHNANGKTSRLVIPLHFSKKKFPHIFLSLSSFTEESPSTKVFDSERRRKASSEASFML
jgi:hypothetical protein